MALIRRPAMAKKPPPLRETESSHGALAAALRERTAQLRQANASLAAERQLAREAEQRGRSTADALREATVALTRSLDRETVLATLLDHLRRLIPFDSASV